MKLIHYLIDRLFFAVGLVTGSQLPAFVSQYRQQLAGRLLQLEEDLLLFQQVADRYFNGDLQALIAHHLTNTDATFQAEGFALQSMLVQQQLLSAIYQKLQVAALPEQLLILLHNGDQETAMSTWQNFQPAIVASVDAVIVTLVVGFIFAVGYQLIVKLVRMLSRNLLHSIASSKA